MRSGFPCKLRPLTQNACAKEKAFARFIPIFAESHTNQIFHHHSPIPSIAPSLALLGFDRTDHDDYQKKVPLNRSEYPQSRSILFRSRIFQATQSTPFSTRLDRIAIRFWIAFSQKLNVIQDLSLHKRTPPIRKPTHYARTNGRTASAPSFQL